MRSGNDTRHLGHERPLGVLRCVTGADRSRADDAIMVPDTSKIAAPMPDPCRRMGRLVPQPMAARHDHAKSQFADR